MLLAWAETDAGAGACHGQAHPHEPVDLRAVQREGHGDERAGHHDVADLDDAARVGVGHKLRDTQREDEGGDAHGQRHDTHEHRRPAGHELQVGGQKNRLDAHEEEGDGACHEAGAHLRGLQERLGQKGDAVLLLDALLHRHQDHEQDQAEDGHGQGRGDAEDGEGALGEGLDEAPGGDAGEAHEEQEQARGGDARAPARRTSASQRASRWPAA